MKSNFIVIEGNIGAGKSSLVRKFSERNNLKPVYEQFEDNAFLPKFYSDPEKYAFTVEMSFLADRFNQLKKVLNNPDIFYDGIMADYFILKSLIFSRITLDKHEYKLFRDVFNIILKQIKVPDLYVYLHKTPDRLIKSINERNRNYEKNITVDYLSKLENSYFEFFKQHHEVPVLLIDTENIDFVNKEKDYNHIENIILSELRKSKK